MSSNALLSFIDSETGEISNLLADRYVDADTICGVLSVADEPDMGNTYRCVHYQVGNVGDTFIVEQTSIYPHVGKVVIMLTGMVYRDHARTGVPGQYL